MNGTSLKQKQKQDWSPFTTCTVSPNVSRIYLAGLYVWTQISSISCPGFTLSAPQYHVQVVSTVVQSSVVLTVLIVHTWTLEY